MKFYARWPLDVPHYAQDHTTLVLVGRWTHLYNLGLREWFTVTDPGIPFRPGTVLTRISLRNWLQHVGYTQGLLHILEDLLGCKISRRKPGVSGYFEPPRVHGGIHDPGTPCPPPTHRKEPAN